MLNKVLDNTPRHTTQLAVTPCLQTQPNWYNLPYLPRVDPRFNREPAITRKRLAAAAVAHAPRVSGGIRIALYSNNSSATMPVWRYLPRPLNGYMLRLQRAGETYIGVAAVEIPVAAGLLAAVIDAVYCHMSQLPAHGRGYAVTNAASLVLL